MASTAAWVVGGVLVAGAVGTAIYFATKKDDTNAPLTGSAPQLPPKGTVNEGSTQQNIPELNALADLASQLNLPINAIDWSAPPPPPFS